MWYFGHVKTFIKHRHNALNLSLYRSRSEETAEAAPAMTYDHIVGFDPNGIRRIYASTWIEARLEARNYIRKRADTAPLSAWRFELFVDTPARTRSPDSAEL